MALNPKKRLTRKRKANVNRSAVKYRAKLWGPYPEKLKTPRKPI